MVSRPFGPIRSESQRQQYSRNSAHPCLSRWSMGRCISCLARYTSATTPREFSWRCRSSLRPPVQRDSARRYCATSEGIPALCWCRPWFRSCSASRESGLDCGEPPPLFLVVFYVGQSPPPRVPHGAQLYLGYRRGLSGGVSHCIGVATWPCLGALRCLHPWPSVRHASQRGVVLRPPHGRCRGLSVVVSHDGPPSSSWTEWNWPSVEPDGKFTDSVKGLVHCTQSSPRSVSRLRLWADRILPCVLSTTPDPER